MARFGFEDFQLDTVEVRLTSPDGPIEMEPQVFDVLALLVERAGSLVTKHELLDTVWGDRFVAESTLSSRISSARAVLGDSGREQRLIRTVHGRGYRFQGEVTRLDAAPPAPLARDPAHPSTGDVATGPTAAPAVHDPVVPGALGALRRTPLVGRDPELARLRDLLEAGPGSGLRIGWVVGEPGIGKSRLVAEAVAEVGGRGGEILLGRCSSDLAVPWQPAIEALEAWMGRRPGIALGDHLGHADRDLLARLVPAIAPDRAERDRVALDGERYRLHKAFGRWLDLAARSTAGGALVWVVDDLHWASPSTLQVLHHLVTDGRDLDVVVLVTARDTAPDEHEDLRRLRAASARADLATVVELAGLDVDAVAAMCGPDDEPEAVRRRSAGNPLMVRAVLADRANHGAVDLDTVVGRRLARLDPATPELLTVAAVAGEEFEVDLLAAAIDRSEDAVLDALDEADAANLVFEVDTDRYRFAHALVREVLREGASRTRVARIHRRLARALASLPGPEPVPAARVLHHLERGGAATVDADRLAELAVAAADHAADQLDVDAALDPLDQVIAHLDEREEHADAGHLRLHRGAVQARLGLNMPAIDAFDLAFRHAREVGDVATMVEAAIGLEGVAWRPGLHGGRALQRIEAAIEAVPPDDRRARARLATAAGRAHAMSGDAAGSRRAFVLAEGLVQELQDPRLQADLLAAWLTRLWTDEDEDVIAAAERLEALGERLASVEDRIIALEIQVCEFQRRGNGRAARSRLAALRALAQHHGSTFWAYVVATHEASDALFRGDLSAAAVAQARARSLGSEQVDQDTSGIDAVRDFLLRRERDDLRRLAPLIRRLAGDASGGSVWAPGRAMLLAEIGDLQGASDALDDLGLDQERVEDALWPMVLSCATEVVHRTGDRDRAALVLPLVQRHADRFLVIGNDVANLGPARRLLGLLHATLGDPATADDELALAATASAAAGSALFTGWCSLHRAELAHAADRPRMAAEHLAEVAAITADHDLPALRRRAHELSFGS